MVEVWQMTILKSTMSSKDLKEISKDLPKNWEVFHSKKSNRPYYYNSATNTTQWKHPNLGEKTHKQDEKPKKRKATVDDQNRTGHEKIKQSNMKQNQTTQEKVPVKAKKEKIDSLVEQSKTPKPQGKPIKFKILPKLSSKVALKKTSAEVARTIPLAPKTCTEQKTPGEVKKKTLQNEAVIQTKKVPKLQPLVRAKSIPVGEGSDSGVSDSSDRILAWLADTSRINFKDHPVPSMPIKESPASEKPKPPLTNISERTTGKQKTEKQKGVILKRVETSTDVSKAENDSILDKLLPKHPQTHTKPRFAPYKLTLPNSKHNKLKRLNQNEHEKDVIGQATAKSNISKASKTTKLSDEKASANQNGLSSGLTNSVARDFGGKPTATQNGFSVPDDEYNVGKTAENECRPTTSFVVDKNVSTPRSAHIDHVQNVNSLESHVQVTNVHNNSHETRQFACSEEIEREELRVVLNDGEILHCEDEVLSMEEGVCSEVSLPLSESDVADMEIDNAEELAKEIVRELKEMRSNVVVAPNHIPSDPMAMKVSSDGYEDSLYIVLDTNVLLSHLKFVVELKDFPIPGVGMPILVIPWVVVQELDSLKENKWKQHETSDGVSKTRRVDMLARVAIKFLNNSFQKSDPRVRGQTVDEAAQHVRRLQEESNDDRILQCCILFHERAQNGSCILFSNDVNLCNKAMVNGIKAFNHQKLIPGLKDLFQCGAIVKQNCEEYNIQLAIEEEQARRRQKADDILCELQIILREGLSYIIESEMKKAYDDLWLDIVHIKPPWTLIDVLQLLDKHWIAVFGHVLKRDRKTLIDKLRQKFDDRKGAASSLQFCSEMLRLALQLFQSFAAHSSYDDAIPKCLAAVNVLVQKCQQFQASTFTSPSADSQPKRLTYPANKTVTSNSSASLERDGVVSGSFVPHEEVTNTFNLIWTAVTQFSTQIFTALGYPNTISDETPQDFPKASKDEAIAFLRVLCPRLLSLVHSIQNVLRDPWDKTSQNNSLFVQLEQEISVFLKEVLSQDNHTTAEKLFNFCQDASTRTSLVQGLSQLDRASGMLQHCAACVAQSNSLNTGMRPALHYQSFSLTTSNL